MKFRENAAKKLCRNVKGSNNF